MLIKETTETTGHNISIKMYRRGELFASALINTLLTTIWITYPKGNGAKAATENLSYTTDMDWLRKHMINGAGA